MTDLLQATQRAAQYKRCTSSIHALNPNAEDAGTLFCDLQAGGSRHTVVVDSNCRWPVLTEPQSLECIFEVDQEQSHAA